MRNLNTMTMEAKGDAIVPQLDCYDLGQGVTAFSTTRYGGYSEGSYGQFNINAYCGDDAAAVSRNREALCRLLGIDDTKLLMPHQVHGTEVTVVDEAFMRLPATARRERLEGVDALMTDVAGVCIGVSTADCIPLLLYDEAHHACCAIHAGWRGTVARIAQKAVSCMTEVYGSDAAALRAQIGPGISLESFEVGDEVYEAFAAAGFDMAPISRRFPASDSRSRWHIDLPACNRQQLLSAGLRPSQVACSSACTFQQPERYFSARRLGIRSGRIFTAIIIR